MPRPSMFFMYYISGATAHATRILPLLMMVLQRRRAALVHEATRILQVGVIGALFRQLPHNLCCSMPVR